MSMSLTGGKRDNFPGLSMELEQQLISGPEAMIGIDIPTESIVNVVPLEIVGPIGQKKGKKNSQKTIRRGKRGVAVIGEKKMPGLPFRKVAGQRDLWSIDKVEKDGTKVPFIIRWEEELPGL